MNIKVLFFGITKDLTGTSETSVSLTNEATVKDFKEILNKKFGKLSNIDSYAIAVNEAYAKEDTVLRSNDIVAIIPPVSGG